MSLQANFSSIDEVFALQWISSMWGRYGIRVQCVELPRCTLFHD